MYHLKLFNFAFVESALFIINLKKYVKYFNMKTNEDIQSLKLRAA